MVALTLMRYLDEGRSLYAAGVRAGGVVAFRWGFEHEGRQVEQRSFLLLRESSLICQPVGFPPEQTGWWYCDLVDIEDEGEAITVRDLYVDVLVGPPTVPYRLLDLDELAVAVSAGVVPAGTASRVCVAANGSSTGA